MPVVARDPWAAIEKPKSRSLRNLLPIRWIEFQWTNSSRRKTWEVWQR
jgi:hypothetical protein